MGVRNLEDLGPNLRKIMNRLLADQNLLKLLYYTDKNPLTGADLTETLITNEIFNKRIKIVPRVKNEDIESGNSLITMTVLRGVGNRDNSEFSNISISFAIYVPYDEWIIVNENLRPFAILGRLKTDLNGKKIDGFGQLKGGDFELAVKTSDYAAYTMDFQITEYD